MGQRVGADRVHYSRAEWSNRTRLVESVLRQHAPNASHSTLLFSAERLVEAMTLPTVLRIEDLERELDAFGRALQAVLNCIEGMHPETQRLIRSAAVRRWEMLDDRSEVEQSDDLPIGDVHAQLENYFARMDGSALEDGTTVPGIVAMARQLGQDRLAAKGRGRPSREDDPRRVCLTARLGRIYKNLTGLDPGYANVERRSDGGSSTVSETTGPFVSFVEGVCAALNTPDEWKVRGLVLQACEAFRADPAS